MTAIECKIIREGGSIIPMGDVEYHFAPRADGAHVAEVENEEHADRFLSITEGYRLYRGEVAAPAPEGERTEESFDTMPNAIPPAADEREALAAEYESLYGKAPHARTGIEKLRELIAAKQ
jgi:hypothetical protein